MSGNGKINSRYNWKRYNSYLCAIGSWSGVSHIYLAAAKLYEGVDRLLSLPLSNRLVESAVAAEITNSSLYNYRFLLFLWNNIQSTIWHNILKCANQPFSGIAPSALAWSSTPWLLLRCPRTWTPGRRSSTPARCGVASRCQWPSVIEPVTIKGTIKQMVILIQRS